MNTTTCSNYHMLHYYTPCSQGWVSWVVPIHHLCHHPSHLVSGRLDQQCIQVDPSPISREIGNEHTTVNTTTGTPQYRIHTTFHTQEGKPQHRIYTFSHTSGFSSSGSSILGLSSQSVGFLASGSLIILAGRKSQSSSRLPFCALSLSIKTS